MSNPNPPPPTPALTLTYDNYTPAKDPRSRRLLPAYWLGTLLAGFLYAAITTPIYLFKNPDTTFGPWIQGGLLSVGFAIIFILPDTIFLGLTLWLRGKLLKHSRFAKFKTALLTGFVGGLYPAAILQTLEVTADTSLLIFLGALAWHTLYPTAAAFWLCYKSNLRD